ncbi:hypothetical protein EV121DRAFT_295824 [Schizophyllum commune]
MASGDDPTALAALIVSLIALIVTLLQLVQQYASTAYDYRRCSKRVLGQWALRTRRHFIFSEVRFEVTFSTPHLSVFFPRDDHTLTEKATRTTLDSHDLRVPAAPKQFIFEPERPAIAQWASVSMAPKTVLQYDVTDRPWFLNLEDPTVPEARCAWLYLLAAATTSDVGLYVKERRWSYDYMPAALTRPIASADKASFLSLLSLWKVSWRKKSDGIYVGTGPQCEVRVNDIHGFGPVYVVDMRPDKSTRYQCRSETARRAMFNEFNVGFGRIRTGAEIKESVSKTFEGMDTKFAEKIQEWYEGDQWCIGVGLLVACWCIEPSMPKVITDNGFLSVYSAHTLSTGLAHVRTLQMLCGSSCVHPLRKSNAAIQQFLSRVDMLYMEVNRELIAPHLLNAISLSDDGDYITHNRTSWTTANACLHAINVLDDHFAGIVRYMPWDAPYIKRLLAYYQLKHAVDEYPAATELATKAGSFWLQELDLVIATDAQAVVRDMLKALGTTLKQHESTFERLVVNRLMRGALWLVHNSNAPSKHNERTALECTLTHEMLADKTTVYLA